jgi:chemotaxis protein CheD
MFTAYDAKRAYLHPGHLLVSVEPIEITTVIGSCVSVCLWDRELRFGGMNHFVLPGVVGGTPTLKHGEQAMNELLLRMLNSGASQRNLRARVFGGSCVIEAFRNAGTDLGSKNIQVAKRVLAAHRIPIVQEDVGGTAGRKLVFHTEEGNVVVKSL